MENYQHKSYSLNTSNINNSSYHTNSGILKSISEKETNYEKILLNSMKDSLDTFLINLKTKSFSKNISSEDIQNYFLTESEKLNSLNIDLISPYQSLLRKNINKKNYLHNKKLKRAYSSGEMPNFKKNNNNNTYNSFKLNSYLNDNILNGITQNNSLLFNDNNLNMNKNLTINNYNNNANINNCGNKFSNKKIKKVDYPIKLISKKKINNIEKGNNLKERKIRFNNFTEFFSK